MFAEGDGAGTQFVEAADLVESGEIGAREFDRAPAQYIAVLASLDQPGVFQGLAQVRGGRLGDAQ